MISTAEYREFLLRCVHPLPAEPVSLEQARGLYLAEPVTSRHPVPAFDNAAMDGYAVRQADLPRDESGFPLTLPVSMDIPAGPSAHPTLEGGTAARIMTGAAMPAGADTVIPVELTDGGTQHVRIDDAPAPHSHVRLRGENIGVGDPVVAADNRLTATHLAAVAAAGLAHVRVHPRPRVAIIVTGSELVAPGETLAPGMIPDSNTTLLSGLVAQAGARVMATHRVPDDAEALAATIRTHASTVDLILLSGGVSAGAYDVVREVLSPMPGMRFEPVAMQPGKPQGGGVLPEGTPVCALPGNPVSVLVSFAVFVRPMLARMRGERERRPDSHAYAGRGWRSPAGREQYMPVSIRRDGDGRMRVVPASAGGSASHFVGSLGLVQGLAIVPPKTTVVEPGDPLNVIVMDQ